MKKITFPTSPTLLLIIHLLPLISSVFLLFLACIPHFYYLLNGELYEDMSLFGLLANTMENCAAYFKGTANEDVAQLYFTYIMLAFSILSILFLIWYTLFVIFTGFLAVCVNTLPPQSAWLNQAKRYYRLLVPNRVCFLLWQFLPMLPAFFPFIIKYFYRTRLGLITSVHFYTLPDPVWVAILACLSGAAYLWSLNAQKELHQSLFHLYRK